MVKRLRFDESGVKKGAWSEDEDEKLRAYIQRYGHWNWSLLPKFAGVSRSGKSCRLRWMNYLRPNLKHGNFTKEEDDTIVNLHNKLGTKWSAMAAMLQGRSDNAIKNRWNTHLKKRVQVRQSALNLEPDQVNPQQKVVKESDQKVQHEGEVLRAGVSYESSISSSSTESSSCLWSGLDFAVSSDVTPQVCDYEPVGSFWTEPFLLDSDSIISSPLNLADEFIFPSCEDMMMTGEFLLSKFD